MNQATGTAYPAVKVSYLQYPGLALEQRDAHKLRGYIGTYFKERSNLYHHHLAEGGLRYGYPLVQYKIMDGDALIVGMQAGSELLSELAAELREITIEGRRIGLPPPEVRHQQWEPVSVQANHHRYFFDSPWLALSEENHRKYQDSTENARQALLSRILVGNVLSFCKGAGIRLRAEDRIIIRPEVFAVPVQFKNQTMLGFKGSFESNMLLPDFIGLGKSVSRGFGTIRKA